MKSKKKVEPKQIASHDPRMGCPPLGGGPDYTTRKYVGDYKKQK